MQAADGDASRKPAGRAPSWSGEVGEISEKLRPRTYTHAGGGGDGGDPTISSNHIISAMHVMAHSDTLRL